MSISPRELVTGTIEIASLPEVFLRVNELIDSPRSSAADIGHIIGQDPGLTSRLLKIVNSAFYGFPSQIDTVSRAITIIGNRELRDMILATSVAAMFKGLPNELVNMETFWRHSLCTGLAARALAAQRHEPQIERFFVAGLLHDIGSLLLYRKLPELAREALLRSRYSGIPLHQAEQEVIGFDHTVVGVEILRLWRLPEHLQEAVEFHHTPLLAEQFPRDTALIHLADAVANAMQMGSPGDHGERPPAMAVWELAGLKEDVVAPVITEVEQRFDDAFQFIYKQTPQKVARLH